MLELGGDLGYLPVQVRDRTGEVPGSPVEPGAGAERERSGAGKEISQKVRERIS